MVVAAVLVLLLSILAVAQLARRARGRAGSATVRPPQDRLADTQPVPVPPATTAAQAMDATAPLLTIIPAGEGVNTPTGDGRPGGLASNTELMSFLVELGGAMIDSGDPVTHINASLALVARANGVPDAQVVVMATALFVSVPGETVSTAVAAAGSQSLRLDQIDAVFEVVHAAERGLIGPAEGLRRLAAAREMPATFSRDAQVAGYVVFTLGLALIMQSSLTEIALAVALGAGVGLLEQWAGRFPQPFRVFLPVGSAFGVSVAVFLLGRLGMDVSGFTSLIAPLVAFIPGALLTTGVIELATGQVVSGSGRLAAGAMRLVLLALGILSAAQLVGVPATTISSVAPNPLGEFSAWVGVAVFGLGIVVNRCARKEALPWILVILYVAYAGQVIGGMVLGTSLAAFCGAVIMTPVAMFVASQESGPTTLVSFLPGFWILVPGSVGLVGVTNLLGEHQEVGLDTLMSAGATMVSIALGVMLGLAVAAMLRRPLRPDAAATGPQSRDWTGTLVGLPPR
jgi:uncharacterized membrane protein YjjP (DUF1212 family)/uncharacterized membrane protein YjjB (DUF3815 family)